jgi:glycosyltransferase involved in cell wall biosynthesis
MLRHRDFKIIYDLDDAVMFRSSRHWWQYSWRRWRRFVATAQFVDCILTGNNYLAEICRRYNQNVHVIPTCIDTSLYQVRPDEPNPERLILGWIGGAKSLVFLEQMKPVWNRLGIRFENLRLKIVCNRFFECQDLPVIKKQWQLEDEPHDVASFHIGISPLPDDPWTRGKSATKLLQCMAAGVPTVSSPVGAHCDIITHGVNGLLASSDDEWFDCISELVKNPEKRRTMGLTARKTVEKKYSLGANAPRLLEVLTKVSS